MTSEEKSEHGQAAVRDPGCTAPTRKRRKETKNSPQSLADGDPRLIDKRLLLQCSATILSTCVMQCSWQASSGSERRDWGRCSVDDGSRQAKARVVRWNMQAGWLFDGSLVELVWLEILSPGEGCAKGLGIRWRKVKRGPAVQNCRPLVQEWAPSMSLLSRTWGTRAQSEDDQTPPPRSIISAGCGRETTALLQDAIANAGYLHGHSFDLLWPGVCKYREGTYYVVG